MDYDRLERRRITTNSNSNPVHEIARHVAPSSQTEAQASHVPRLHLKKTDAAPSFTAPLPRTREGAPTIPQLANPIYRCMLRIPLYFLV
jgi:hypothetical protein